MTDKQIRKLTDKYLRAEIKTDRHDKRINKSLIILTKDFSLFVLIIYILFN
jgi:hypothetical protein